MADTAENIPTIELPNGIALPMVGFGTYQMPPRITQSCVREALAVGYRAVDTAQCYGNEEEVGRAVETSGLARGDVFLTTKTWTDGYRSTKAGIARSASLLGGYVDLLLVHEPTSDIKGSWRAVEEAYDAGLAHAIGVSNFMGANLDELLRVADITPMVDQVETHVYRQRQELQALLADEGIALQSWSPLACGRNGIFDEPVLIGIARTHGKTVVQVALRWLLQRGVPLNVKSTHGERMRENLGVFDFELDEGDMQAIASLDTGRSQFGWW